MGTRPRRPAGGDAFAPVRSRLDGHPPPAGAHAHASDPIRDPRQRVEFTQEWRGATDEQAEAQSLYTELFAVFGVAVQDRRATPLECVPFCWAYGRVEAAA